MADQGDPQAADEKRDHCGDDAAGARADLRRGEVGEAERSRDEVGHQVDAHRRGEEGERSDDGEREVVHLGHDLRRIGYQLTEQHGSAGGDEQRQEGKEGQAHRQAEEVAPLHLRLVLDEAREVAVIDHHRGKVGHHRSDHRGKGRNRAARMLAATVEDGAELVHQPTAGLVPDHPQQRDHDQIDERTGPVEEIGDPVEAAQEKPELKHAHDRVRRPVDRVHAEEGAATRALEQRIDQQGDRGGREIGLHAVPEDRDDGADQGREVGPAHTHGRACDHRVRDAVFDPRFAGEIDQHIDDDARQDDAGKHRPAVEPVGDEQRGRQGVAEQALDVVGPDVEYLEPPPLALLHR